MHYPRLIDRCASLKFYSFNQTSTWLDAKQEIVMDKIENRLLSFSAMIVAALILLTLLLVQVWQVGAQGTDDTGGVIVGPPTEGSAVRVSSSGSPDSREAMNVHPVGEEPRMMLGDVIAETESDDQGEIQRAAFGFRVSNPGTFSFAGSVNALSAFTAGRWNNGRLDTTDVAVRCLTSDGQWTAENISSTVMITPVPHTDGIIGYNYSVSGTTRQEGTCGLFFANRVNRAAARDSDGNDGNQTNRDVNMLGIAP